MSRTLLVSELDAFQLSRVAGALDAIPLETLRVLRDLPEALPVSFIAKVREALLSEPKDTEPLEEAVGLRICVLLAVRKVNGS